MSSTDLTREWLQSVLRPYPARDRILSEVLDVLGQRRTLSVKTDAFTFDSGQTALLLLLHGTLPINYRGATYQIPLNLWIPYSYPREPPMAYVVPTKEMGVRKGREVEPGGRVREEIIEEWWRNWQVGGRVPLYDQADGKQEKGIEMLLRQLTSVFSVTPPVYARPPETISSPATAGPSSQPRPPERPRSLYDGSNTASGANQGFVRQQNGPPPPPARPGYGPPNPQPEILPQYRSAPTPPPQTFQSQPFPMSPSHQASGSYVQQARGQSPQDPPQSPRIPPRPPHIPPRQSSQPPASPSGPSVPYRPHVPVPPQAGPPSREVSQQPMTPSRPTPLSSQQPPYPPAQPQAPPIPNGSQYSYQEWPQANGNHPSQAQLSGPSNVRPPEIPYQGQSPYPSSTQYQTSFSQHQPSSTLYQASGQPFQTAPPVTRQPLPDLMSSPSNSFSSLPETSTAATSPPPIPPSKLPPPSLLHLHSILLPHLSASLPPIIHSLQANRAHLVERHEDLASGEPAIRDEMARLEAVKKVCDSVGRRMAELVARGEERVVELEGRGEVSVDEVVCGISIVHNQLIDLVAEDNAIEDTIYHMTRALDSERIDLDRFLKSIRSLAREQYMKRALIERILQGMGQNQIW